ncbi:hypothetical protein KC319_g5756, partial [Hortaea werneckii]
PGTLLATSPGSPIATSKTKKELKAEEKERKAQLKAQQKLDEQKRKEESAKRVERWKKQDEEYKQVLEMSKQSAIDEAKRRGDEGAGGGGGAGGGEKSSGSFSRFTRPGSMSLRGKPKFFGKDKADASASQQSAGAASPSLPTLFQGQPPSNNASDATDFAAAGAPPPATPESGVSKSATTDSGNPLAKVPSANGGTGGEEQKKLRNRFSLGRKKSGMM